MAVIKEIELREENLITINGELLITRYNLIDSFVKSYIVTTFPLNLANCKVEKERVIFFSDDKIQYKPLRDFSAEEKNEILKMYNRCIYEIQDACIKLKSEWVNILNLVFNQKSNEIFFGQGQLLIVWGLNLNNEKINYIPREDIFPTNKSKIINDASNQIKKEESGEIGNSKLDHANDPEMPEHKKIFVRSNKTSSNSISNFIIWLFYFFGRAWWLIILILLIWYFFNKKYCLFCQ